MKKPTLLHYYVTDICNAKCEFCDIWENKDRHDVTLEQVKKNLWDARKAGAQFVDFTGGEPTLNPQLGDFLAESKRLGFITSVTTNTLLFKKRVASLAGKVDLLHFSLDADTAELHDKIRGIKSFDSTVEAIPVALEHGLIPDLLFTYTNENINHFMGVWELAREHKLMVILDPVFSMDSSEIVSEESHAIARGYAKLPGVYLNKAHHTLRKNGGNHTDNPRCRAVSSTIVIKSDNTLALPCYHKSNEQLPIDNNLGELLSSAERLQAQKDEGTLPFCEGCHINCYMDPSYLYKYDALYFESIQAKIRYGVRKYLLDRIKIPPFTRPMPKE